MIVRYQGIEEIVFIYKYFTLVCNYIYIQYILSISTLKKLTLRQGRNYLDSTNRNNNLSQTKRTLFK